MQTVLERVDAWVRHNRWAGDLLYAAAVSPLALISLSYLAYLDDVRAEQVGIACVLVMHVALLGRRMVPAAAFVVITAAHAAQALVVLQPLPSNLVFPLALYALAAYARRPWPQLGLVVGLLGSVAGALLFAGGSVLAAAAEPAVFVLLSGFFGASVLAAWGLGSFRRVRASYVDALEERARRAEQEREERALRAVAEERARVAREMHDVIAHSLSVVVVQAQSGAFAAKRDPQMAVPVLETIASTGRAALADMRGLLGVLRGVPSASSYDSAGAEVEQNPQPGLGELPGLVERTRSAGLHVHCEQSGEPVELSPTAALAVYRVVQESLTNTLKHGGTGASAAVRLDWQVDAVVVTVEDDGYGQAALHGDGGGHGLVGMRERMAVFDGSLEAGPRPGGGFRVMARLPYDRAVAALPGSRS